MRGIVSTLYMHYFEACHAGHSEQYMKKLLERQHLIPYRNQCLGSVINLRSLIVYVFYLLI